MNKRDTLLAGAAIGTYLAGLLGTPSPLKADTIEDWRDELLSIHTHYTLHYVYNTTYEENSKTPKWGTLDYLLVYRNLKESKWKIGHYHNEYDHTKRFPDDRPIALDLEGAHKEFDTLEEAYKYAKSLKEKYYGQA